MVAVPPVPDFGGAASMKVPPKRKGNSGKTLDDVIAWSLNESPSEKEGKYPPQPSP